VGIDYCTSEGVGVGIFGIHFESHSGECQSRSECGRGEAVVFMTSQVLGPNSLSVFFSFYGVGIGFGELNAGE
jgi:hypothetical protein